MKQKCHKILLLISISAALIFTGCKKSEAPADTPPKNNDPGRCLPTDVGEAADFIQQKNIVDDRLIVAQGLTNPQSLVWRDEKTGKTFYLARIMGTERKLFFLKEVPDDSPPPGVLSRFSGQLILWKHLPKQQARHMAAGLKSQYNVDVDMEHAFIVIEGAKPDGC